MFLNVFATNCIPFLERFSIHISITTLYFIYTVLVCCRCIYSTIWYILLHCCHFSQLHIRIYSCYTLSNSYKNVQAITLYMIYISSFQSYNMLFEYIYKLLLKYLVYISIYIYNVMALPHYYLVHLQQFYEHG